MYIYYKSTYNIKKKKILQRVNLHNKKLLPLPLT